MSGPPGRVPREVLGTWWSRYWPYTAEDLQDIARGYARHSLALDIIVSDMAWHYHNEASPPDWAGYGWSSALFPSSNALDHFGGTFPWNCHSGGSRRLCGSCINAS